MTFLWSYTDALAAGDEGWWRVATRHTADLLEAEHWWLDPPGPVPVQHLLVETTALLSYALARSRDGDPDTVTGAQLAAWAAARPLPMLDETVPDSLEGSLSLMQWSKIFEQQRLRQQNDLAGLLHAAGHQLTPAAPTPAPGPLPSADPGRGPVPWPPPDDPVSALWCDLIDRDNPGRRYGPDFRLPGPALALGLGALVQHFDRA
ncbi:hypothetical protein ACTOB_002060 [Actinoplanes oblitus]|uniref:Uncharacterized protein n=1 Tax=Actinoplanes oblitus TaxID=3040509 RepID=A0ABY8WQ63_9ACTN|nr:hypothetical protein [Actinoplanes oblitus]WIM98459.1 hypothetical protein ACTOB_002060 [Actinoplanes oblitus]